MADGMDQIAAHQLALQTSPLYSNYDPEVVAAHPELFNQKWYDYWGLGQHP
jgi:hypothetical protein